MYRHRFSAFLRLREIISKNCPARRDKSEAFGSLQTNSFRIHVKFYARVFLRVKIAKYCDERKRSRANSHGRPFLSSRSPIHRLPARPRSRQHLTNSLSWSVVVVLVVAVKRTVVIRAYRRRGSSLIPLPGSTGCTGCSQ